MTSTHATTWLAGRRRYWLAALVLVTCSNQVGYSDDLQVMPNLQAPVRLLQDWLRPQVHAALDARRVRLEQLTDAETIRAYQRRLRQEMWTSLGGRFAQTPLHARVVGHITGDGYRVEKVIFESQPGFHVTASMYLPLSRPPYPAVLVPCGHTENGKAGYQAIAVLLARNGMAAFCYDPIGQGERKQILNDAGDGPRYKATVEHTYDGVASILLGRSLASYRIWDGMRSLDYLAGREDIDASRIGCTGNSGGGLMTSYLMALDDRIVAAAPGCFITTTRLKNERPGPGDAEQNLFAQIRFGLDHADFAILHAPKPTLICSATRDFVPVEGAWQSFRQSKRIYGRLGFSERVDLVEADAKHGFTRELRVAATGWMQRWLLGKDAPIVETPYQPHTTQQLQCTPTGQVLLSRGARSIFDLHRERAVQLQSERSTRWQKLDDERRRQTIRDIARINTGSPTTVRVAARGTVDRDRYQVHRLVIHTHDGMQLPALKFIPRSASPRRTTLWLHDHGKPRNDRQYAAMATRVDSQHVVLAVDLRGYGETATTPWRFSGPAFGNNAAEFFIAYMLGKSLVGQRAEDILTCTQHALGKSSATVDVVATGAACVPVLHAAALAPQQFGSLTLRDSIRSWQEVVETPVTENQLESTIHDVLRHYDLPDLVAMARSQGVKVTFQDTKE